MRITFNANAEQIGNRDYFLSVMQRLRPTWVLLMSDWEHKLARDVQRVTGNATKVVLRYPNNDEHQEWRGGREYANGVISAWRDRGDFDLYRYVLNEPTISDESLPVILDYLIYFMDTARLNGLHCVVGNWGPGTFTPDQINSGMFDNYIRALVRHAGWHWGGWHEYAAPAMPAITYPPDWLLDPEAESIHPSHWGKRSDYPIRRYGADLPPYWNLLRATWFDIRAQELGLPVLPKVITEWGWDHLTEQVWSPVYEELQRRYGLPEDRHTLRGMDSYEKVWKAWWGGWDFSRAAFEQMKWADSIYPPSYEAFCLFTWSNHWEWDSLGFNVRPYLALHKLLMDYAEAQPVPDPKPVEENPPMGKQVDMLDYLRGDGRVYELVYTWSGGGIQTLQTQRIQGAFYLVKSTGGAPGQWEELWYDTTNIYRGADTSPGGNEMYILFGSQQPYGDTWCPRIMAEGQVVRRSPLVRFYYKDREDELPGKSFSQTTYIKLIKVHDLYQTGSGLSVPDTVELAAYEDDGSGKPKATPFERYWYANNYGLIAWEGAGVGRAYLSRFLPSNTPALTRESVWLTPKLPVRPAPIAAPPPVEPPPQITQRTARELALTFKYKATAAEHATIKAALKVLLDNLTSLESQ